MKDLVDTRRRKHAGDEVIVTGRDTPGEQEDIASEALGNRRSQRLWLVTGNSQRNRLSSRRRNRRRQHRPVGVADLTVGWKRIGRYQFTPRRNDRHPRRGQQLNMAGPGLSGQTDLGRPQPAATDEHGFTRPKAAAPAADVLTAPEARLAEPHPATGMHTGTAVHSPLDRYDCIGSGGYRSPGHDPGTAARPYRQAGGITGSQIGHHLEVDNLSGGCSGSKVSRRDREAVHHRLVPGGRIDVGHHVGGE